MQTPKQVADRANVNAQTIRNYSTKYADLLSPQASGQFGPRLYTDEDVEILCTIAALRRAGVDASQVAERIRNHDVPPIVDLTSSPSNEAINQPHEASKPAQDVAFALQLVQPTLNGRFEAIERRLEAREKGERWWAWGLGFWTGMIFMGVVQLIVWLLVNGPPW